MMINLSVPSKQTTCISNIKKLLGGWFSSKLIYQLNRRVSLCYCLMRHIPLIFLARLNMFKKGSGANIKNLSNGPTANKYIKINFMRNHQNGVFHSILIATSTFSSMHVQKILAEFIH